MPLGRLRRRIALLCLFPTPASGALAYGAEGPDGPARCHAGVYIVPLSDAELRPGTCVADFGVWFRWRDSDYNPLESFEGINGVIDGNSGEVQKFVLKNGQQYACQRIRATIRQACF